jgi:AraC family transcriptional regulator of adaptative response/methylated-DNA-[protein]-cysteine methyltransferase
MVTGVGTRGTAGVLRYTLGQGGLGWMLAAAGPQGLCAFFLGEDPQALRADLAARFPGTELVADGPGLQRLFGQLHALVDRPQQPCPIALDPQGTPFQHRVWQGLRALPPGKTVSYGQLAAALGMPAAVRAVARACGANPVAVAIPCHRVLRADGSLGGYRWGIGRKRALLEREGALLAREGALYGREGALYGREGALPALDGALSPGH